ncbi:MAG: ABC transporter ATP-binding protein [Acetobacteraceae bacterium]|nr:ABC transporter ATP-binding protein [Acetobacteraceae bacterium]
MLRAENLHFSWPGGMPLLAGVAFALRPGVPLVLLGPNGTGKTTLLRCLLGLERPTAGHVTVAGHSLAALSAATAARHIAYVPQAAAAAFAFRALDIVLMGRTPHLGFMAGPTAADRATAEAAMVRLAIAHLAARAFDELSGGERQLVLVARALAQGTRVLVLDEPCASLDIANQMRIVAILRALAADGYAILLTSHLPDHAFLLGGEVALLKDGRLFGPAPPAELLTAPMLEALYGTPIEVVPLTQGRARGQVLCVPVMPAP